MAVKRLWLAVLCVTVAVNASAQNVTTEVSGSTGLSSDNVGMAATQVRVFGELERFTFFTEGTWAASRTWHSASSSEAFSTAYPYEGSHVMDAYVERRIGNGPVFGVIRGGRFRTPFGIHDASDYAYNGFLRAPLIRYEGYWALSNTLFEHGLNAMVGVPRLQGELTVGRSADVGDDYIRRAGTDVVLRAQTYAGPLVFGVSHLESSGYNLSYATGRMQFTGVDMRWMRNGVQMRSEWLVGRPWDGTRTLGGYVDVMVHRSFMGPATIVGRAETLDYNTGNPLYDSTAYGLSLGTRVKVLRGLFAQVNATHRPSAPYAPATMATDVALTYTARYPR